MASVQLEVVSKTYDAAPVVHGIDLDVEDGQFVVLVGPSGCGKSTILRMIAGLESITGGTIRIGGAVVNTLPPKQRDVAMVFQNYALYPHKTVYQNMAFSLRLRGADKGDIDRQVRRAADILGLADELGRYPRQLSGGQRQRVAMGRAIVRDPKVFLFDEPLSNLDAKLRVKMRTEIRSLHEELRTTSIYVTHDQVEAMTMADKIVVLRDGRVEQIGSPQDLYDTPANSFVASFIGSPPMNLLSGHLVSRDGQPGVALADGQVLPLASMPAEEGRAVLYGIRPEDVAIANGHSNLTVTVDVVEPLGPQSLVFTKLGKTELSLIGPKRLSLAHNAEVGLDLDPELGLVFDAQSGTRLVG